MCSVLSLLHLEALGRPVAEQFCEPEAWLLSAGVLIQSPRRNSPEVGYWESPFSVLLVKHT